MFIEQLHQLTAQAVQLGDGDVAGALQLVIEMRELVIGIAKA